MQTSVCTKNLSGGQKAAALLIALGQDLSSEILKHLSDADVERVTAEIVRMERLPSEVSYELMSECLEMATAHSAISQGGIEYARTMLRQAIGQQRANEIIDRLVASTEAKHFQFLAKIDASHVVAYLQDETTQTIALILSNLPSGLAAEFLVQLPPQQQADVAVRVANMQRTSPDVMKAMEEVLKKKLSSVLNQDSSMVGGLDFLVQVLGQVNRTTEKTILDALEVSSPELADEIRKQLFVFDDLVKLDNRSLQRVLREVDPKDLGLALRGASDEVKRKIFQNMSSRAALMLQEDMEVAGPVKRRVVDDAQQRVVAIVRRLDDAEEIVISRGREDDFLV